MNGRLTRFLPAEPSRKTFDQFWTELARSKPGCPEEVARMHYNAVLGHKIWKNDEYQVNIDEAPAHGFGAATVLWHLSIKRLNKNPIHDWRDLQAIKNALVGHQYEAIELYPASDRVVDTANQMHLWVFIEVDGERAPKLPVGWFARLVEDKTPGQHKQRALDGAGDSL
jgi:hypothetical protein